MELTKEYFEEKFSRLVTKDHLEQRLRDFATKDDLLELATKSHFETIRLDIAEVKAIVETLKITQDEDTRAAFRDIVDLKERVSILERSVSHK